MALTKSGFKQRIVGAIVLVSLAVIFLPMLFSNTEKQPVAIAVTVPPEPEKPVMPKMKVEKVAVPKPEVDETVMTSPNGPVGEANHFKIIDEPDPHATKKVISSAKKTTKTSPKAQLKNSSKKIDSNNLPVVWSVQVASLSSIEKANLLRDKLRNKGYKAYVRDFDKTHKVFVGPVLEKREANSLLNKLKTNQNINGFVTRFRPEAG